MTVYELLEGILKTIRVGKYRVAVLDHVRDRARTRKLKTWHIARILERLPSLESEIDDLELRQGFFVVDRKLNVSLGMSRYSKNDLTLITVIDSSNPYAKDVNTYFYV